MPKPLALDPEACRARLATLPAWQHDAAAGTIRRSWSDWA